MMASPSQDPQARVQAQAEWRTLRIARAAGAIVLLTAMLVSGIGARVIGQVDSGLTALAIGGVGGVLTIAGRTFRRRPPSGTVSSPVPQENGNPHPAEGCRHPDRSIRSDQDDGTE